ncbi:MAG: peptide chain release factor N(5)-glutamine methyltransferase [Endomicrobium sp.]|jgi:release factor glutamine methyltransferase|nr:peptide chain release factor N(5)-glutamine methyltransferase [Endomicrobium sp.]
MKIDNKPSRQQPNDVYSALKNAEHILTGCGLRDAKSSAEILLSFILNTSRSKLFLIRTRELSENETAVFDDYILRRSKREPVEYITGFCGFMGYEFYVNENVLIPRPETELLTEEVLKEVKPGVLDLCTGSGCIAVSLAKSGLFKKITASDISEKALETAVKNAGLNGVQSVEFVKSDVFENLMDMKFDIIVSNPPYVSQEEYERLEPELGFEPKIALTAPDDGLFFYKKIAKQSGDYLNEGGMIFLELNANKSGEIKKIFQDAGFKHIKIINDYAGLPRILKAGI